jgi:ABC-type uncharacterized transport system substrate-binding protein
MRRRQFIILLGGAAAAAWPLATRAQQAERIRHIGVLMAFSENDPEAQSWARGFREELGKLGWTEGHNIQIDTRWATADVESLQRFAKQLLALQPDLILTGSTPATAAMRQQTNTIPIVFAMVGDPVGARYRVPAIYPFRFFVTAGGLMSYGIEISETFRRSTAYVDRILKGAAPADLPVQTPVNFKTVVNLRTAKALGFTISPTLLVAADEVIE